MPTIRDLVKAIRQREGVEAAVVLGPDGLLIESQALTGLETEDIAAMVPGFVGAVNTLGYAAGRGAVLTSVAEHEGGFIVVSVLSPDAVLLVLTNPTADVGRLLFELRRNRENIASLV